MRSAARFMADDPPMAREAPHAAARDQTLEAQVSAAIVRCAGGDRPALRLIYDLEAARMIGVAMRIVHRKDLAEEAVQEALTRVWRAAHSFDAARGTARAWVYVIVRNQALNIWRDERRHTADEFVDSALEEPDHALSRLPESMALRRCLQQLDAHRRAAVVLTYVHGLSHAELAGRLGVPLGTVKSWVRRGLLSLQECMG